MEIIEKLVKKILGSVHNFKSGTQFFEGTHKLIDESYRHLVDVEDWFAGDAAGVVYRVAQSLSQMEEALTQSIGIHL